MEKKIEPGFVDILILFFNKVDQTISCVNSFLSSGQNIYVLNNGSDSEQLKKIQHVFKYEKNVFILDAGKNLGVSGGRNFLINYTRAPWLFSVDNDITINQKNDWLQNFQQYLLKYPKLKIISPLMYNVHEDAYSQQLKLKLEKKRMFIETGNFDETNCFPGGASIIHRSIFDSYGFFDESLFVGFEDYEFGLRAMLSSLGPLSVHHVGFIELFHDHQFQKKNKDKEAVRLRYSKDKIKQSYDSIVKKYDIEFDHDWSWWTRNQLSVMTEPKLLRKLKHRIKRILP